MGKEAKIIILLLVFLFLFAACGTDDALVEPTVILSETTPNPTNIPTPTQVTETPKPEPTVIILTLPPASPTPEATVGITTAQSRHKVEADVYIYDQPIKTNLYSNTYEGKSDLYRCYVQAQPIMDFLDIEYNYDIEGNYLSLDSEEYGEHTFDLGEVALIIDKELYVQFVYFRVYTDGSLKQEDTSAVYLYTPYYIRDDIPYTLEECYEMLDDELTAEDIEYMKTSTSEDRIMMHFGFGMWIRNNWIYPNIFLCEVFNDSGISHPDDMSVIIIEGYYLYLNGMPCGMDDVLKSLGWN